MSFSVQKLPSSASTAPLWMGLHWAQHLTVKLSKKQPVFAWPSDLTHPQFQGWGHGHLGTILLPPMGNAPKWRAWFTFYSRDCPMVLHLRIMGNGVCISGSVSSRSKPASGFCAPRRERPPLSRGPACMAQQEDLSKESEPFLRRSKSPRWEGRALRPWRPPSPQGAAALEAEGRALGQGQPGAAQRSPPAGCAIRL